MNSWAVIVAAGRGSRAALGENKVFYILQGRSVLGRCLDAFADRGRFDGAVLVLSKEDESRYAELALREGPFPLVKKIVYGGPTRQDSVRNGLLAVPECAQIVAIHDAARPFVSDAVIAATLESAEKYGSGVICTPVVDTIKQIDSQGHVTSLERDSLRAVQTPQAFKRDSILTAHLEAQKEGYSGTDDAMLFEHCYGHVHLVSADGAEENRKLTTKNDFDMRREERVPAEVRVGHGYDVHRLTEGRKLILCGVRVPYERGLAGHSDADVAVHALMDALLGAMGMGDIGGHFPDTDPQWQGADSMVLLDTVMCWVRSGGWRVGNADITIIAQAPKLSPHIPNMKQNLARGLCVESSRVNVKATTTERLGFEGEGLGISSHAVVTIYRMEENI